MKLMQITRRSALSYITATVLFLAVGCATVFDLARIESRAKAVSFGVSAAVLKNNPSFRDEFIEASSNLKFVVSQDVIDVTSVIAIISQLPLLQDGSWSIAVQLGIIIFTGELDTLAVKNPEHVKLAGTGFYKGIDMALGFVAPKALKAPERVIKQNSPNVR